MKKLSFILSFFIIISVIVTPLTASADTMNSSPDSIKITSKTALLYSPDTDDTLYDKASDVKRYPASLTKLMTALVVMENCQDIDKKITVNASCFDELSGSGSTVSNLKDGEVVSIRDLLHMLLICSSADAADVLACEIGGSIDGFVQMMNDTAQKMQMKKTHFMNAHGLHDENHYTTAKDMLILAKQILETPVIMQICSKSSYTVKATNKSDERTIVTTNLLQNQSSGYYYKYAKGMKTGFTTPAGRCLISTASYKGYNYICIIMGGDDSTRSEYSDSKTLYRWAFLNYEYRKILTANDIIDKVDVKLSWQKDQLMLYPEKNVSAIVPSDIDNSSIVTDAVLSADTVNAPIKEGQILGYARIMCQNREIARVNLVAKENVKRSTMLLIKETAKSIIASKTFKILACLLVLMLIAAFAVNIIHNKRKFAHVKKVRKIRKY